MFDVSHDRLPRVDEVPLNLALMVLGKALAQAYAESADQALPERLTTLLRRIEEREAHDGQRA